jgi:hypothetical protein
MNDPRRLIVVFSLAIVLSVLSSCIHQGGLDRGGMDWPIDLHGPHAIDFGDSLRLRALINDSIFTLQDIHNGFRPVLKLMLRNISSRDLLIGFRDANVTTLPYNYSYCFGIVVDRDSGDFRDCKTLEERPVIRPMDSSIFVLIKSHDSLFYDKEVDLLSKYYCSNVSIKPGRHWAQAKYLNYSWMYRKYPIWIGTTYSDTVRFAVTTDNSE